MNAAPSRSLELSKCRHTFGASKVRLPLGFPLWVEEDLAAGLAVRMPNHAPATNQINDLKDQPSPVFLVALLLSAFPSLSGVPRRVPVCCRFAFVRLRFAAFLFDCRRIHTHKSIRYYLLFIFLSCQATRTPAPAPGPRGSMWRTRIFSLLRHRQLGAAHSRTTT